MTKKKTKVQEEETLNTTELPTVAEQNLIDFANMMIEDNANLEMKVEILWKSICELEDMLDNRSNEFIYGIIVGLIPLVVLGITSLFYI